MRVGKAKGTRTLVTGVPPVWVHSSHVGQGDGTPLNLGIVQNGNGLRTRMTQESHGFSRVECQKAGASS
jgi:hypothetical protein